MPANDHDARTTYFFEQPGWRTALLALAVVFFLCRFLHLSADYPHWVRWEDGVLTDEGWYAGAAINLHAWGKPLLSGDMNTAVLMPVWPLLAHAAFRLFGYHVEVLRGLSVLASLLAAAMTLVLLRRYGATRWVPLFLLLLAVNPWAFVVARTAFLEAPMLALFFAALLLVVPQHAGWLTRNAPEAAEREGLGRMPSASRSSAPSLSLRSVAAGLLFGLALLTKTSAVPLLPVLLFAVLQAHDLQWRAARNDACLLCGTAALVAGLFYMTVSRHFSTDARYYLSTVPDHLALGVHALAAQVTRPFRYGAGADHLLFALDMLLLLASALMPQVRRFWRDPLFALAGVWLVSVLVALVLLNNVMVHYFALVLPALPLLAIAVLRMPAAWVPLRWQRVFVLLLCCDVAGNIVQTASFILRPRYTFRDAARQIDAIVHNSPSSTDVVLGDNAPEVALLSDLRPVNLFAHSASISQQVDRFAPDWWLQYTPEDDGSCFRVLLSQAYTAQARGSWVIPDGRRLVLYRLHRRPGAVLPYELSVTQKAACRSPYVASMLESAEVPVESRWSR